MSEMYKYVLLIYAVLNFVSFAFFAADKKKAINNEWRIPEATLIFVSVLGIFGGILGMKLMHHKTKKPKFYIGLPAIFVIELAALIYALIKL